jgi:hypothetical protein
MLFVHIFLNLGHLDQTFGWVPSGFCIRRVDSQVSICSKHALTADKLSAEISSNGWQSDDQGISPRTVAGTNTTSYKTN